MADKVKIKVAKRETLGSSDARRQRRDGKVPVSIYGAGKDTVAAVAELSDLAAILRSDSGVNTIFTLDLEGEGAGDVIFHDRQIHPLKGTLMHADLRRLAKGEKIEVTVPIHLLGEPIGTTEEDGVLSQTLREIKVLCEPSAIPDAIEADVSEMKLNDVLHVSDLKIGDNIEVHEDPETVVASIVFIAEPDLEPTPEEEVTEPELVDEKGEGEEGGEPGEGEPESEQS